jgi:uncharacterized membrane protein
MLGIALGSAAFLAALTPSLIPRAGPVQGAVAGLAFAAFYAIGAGTSLLWSWLGLPAPAKRAALVNTILIILSGVLVLTGLVMAGPWQNAIHTALGMPDVETVRPLVIAGVAVATILILVLLGRLFRLLKDLYALPIERVLPRRAAFIVASALAGWSFWAIGNGFLLDAILRGLDSAYRQVDAIREAESPAPADPLKTGSAASLVSWSGLGAEGRSRILSAPSAEEIGSLSGGTAETPLRVYIGLNSAETPEARAALALSELIRIGAFERKLLVIATPTGTGWVDPAAMIPLEVLHRGDVATVSVQYSYLPSWLSLLVEPVYGQETAQAVFSAVYGHWRSLPKAGRPRLYLFGLSLGALNSDLASNAFDIIGDPYDGAFWVGPPFASRTWREVTTSRRQGSPWWLPEPRNAELFRFMTNADKTPAQTSGWGTTRILYLQYPSDPIVFFDRHSWRRQPSWLDQPRASDVPKALVWIPIVTSLQLIFDMMTATTVPKGVGHVYAASHYLKGWVALTEPDDWSAEGLRSLEAWLDAKGL